jgi:hypothetical protein
VTGSISMCLTTAASGDGPQRRIANHHSNLWDDDFIQSLETPYEVIFIFEFILRLHGYPVSSGRYIHILLINLTANCI